MTKKLLLIVGSLVAISFATVTVANDHLPIVEPGIHELVIPRARDAQRQGLVGEALAALAVAEFFTGFEFDFQHPSRASSWL